MTVQEKIDDLLSPSVGRSLYQEICAEVEGKGENDGNHPSDFETLKPAEQYALLYWITSVAVHTGTYERRSSYSIKHDFEQEGFYITNGQFKGAMLRCGYRPKDPQELNWSFRMRPYKKVAASSRDYDPQTDWRYRLSWFDKEFACALYSAGHLRLDEG